jgi:hypothetical protein
VYFVVLGFWVLYFFFELGSWYMDYDLRWTGEIRRTAVGMGRMATTLLFMAK